MLRSGGARRACATPDLDELSEHDSAIECGAPAEVRALPQSDRPGGDPRGDRADDMSCLWGSGVRPVLGTRKRVMSGLRRVAGRRRRRRRRSPERHRARPMANDSPGADRRRDRRLRCRGIRVRHRQPVPAGGWSGRGARAARVRHGVVPRSVASAVVVERSDSAERVAGGLPIVSGQRVAGPQRRHRPPVRRCHGNAAVDTRSDAAAHGRAHAGPDARADPATDAQADPATDADTGSDALHPGCA